MNYLALVAVLFLFMADYLAIVVWLMRTSGKSEQPVRFGMRTLFIAMTVAGVHFGILAAFLSARS